MNESDAREIAEEDPRRPRILYAILGALGLIVLAVAAFAIARPSQRSAFHGPVVTFRDGRKCAIEAVVFEYEFIGEEPPPVVGPLNGGTFSNPIVVDMHRDAGPPRARRTSPDLELAASDPIRGSAIREIRFLADIDRDYTRATSVELDIENQPTLVVERDEERNMLLKGAGPRKPPITLRAKSSDVDCAPSVSLDLSSVHGTLAAAPLRVELRR